MIYGSLASIYDLLLSGVDYEAWADYIEELIDIHEQHPLRVLDLACGTGNSSIPLAKRGYYVVGVDMSEQMLEIAKQKARAAGVEIHFVCQDMRNLDLADKYDLAVIFQDGINYMLTEEDLTNALKGIKNILVPGGIAIFDLNMINLLPIKKGKETIRLEEDGLVLTWESEYFPEKGLWVIDFCANYFEQGKEQVAVREIHREKFYHPDVIKRILASLGFCIKGIYKAFSIKPPSESTRRIFFIVQKPVIDISRRENNEYCFGGT